jgi:hypothetical protein
LLFAKIKLSKSCFPAGNLRGTGPGFAFSFLMDMGLPMWKHKQSGHHSIRVTPRGQFVVGKWQNQNDLEHQIRVKDYTKNIDFVYSIANRGEDILDTN